MMGFREAEARVLQAIPALPVEEISLEDAEGRIVSTSITARISSPEVPVSLRDGFAVRAEDTAGASEAFPVRIPVAGHVRAGDAPGNPLPEKTAMRINTGAPLPEGADAVIQVEDCREESGRLVVHTPVRRGMFVMLPGGNIRSGEPLVEKGRALTPAALGVMAATGYGKVSVYRKPVAGLLATGDELVPPGAPAGPGKIHTSNLVAQAAWLRRFGYRSVQRICGDTPATIRRAVEALLEVSDVMCISGGAWKSDRDYTAACLAELGWRKVFHHVRLGPGKAAGFGILHGKPVFVLPGGPLSNETAFLMLALPAIRRMENASREVFPRVTGVAGESMKADPRWMDVTYTRMTRRHGSCVFTPVRSARRFAARLASDSFVCIPEGVAGIGKGETVTGYMLDGWKEQGAQNK